VEKRYNKTVLDPIFESREISDKEATPLIREAKTRGTAKF